MGVMSFYEKLDTLDVKFESIVKENERSVKKIEQQSELIKKLSDENTEWKKIIVEKDNQIKELRGQEKEENIDDEQIDEIPPIVQNFKTVQGHDNSNAITSELVETIENKDSEIEELKKTIK